LSADANDVRALTDGDRRFIPDVLGQRLAHPGNAHWLPDSA